MNRVIRIATCTLAQDAKASPYEQALSLVDQAGRSGADIVCLPEYAASAQRRDGDFLADLTALPVPGPDVNAFAALAGQHRMYVIVPLVERGAGAKPFNAALLLDRRGALAGVYRKTHLCLPAHGEGERYQPGDDLPVFATDFGRIAITLCMDLHYPEVYTTLALRGAEVIFWPTAALDYTGDLIESLVNARAIDNQVYFVTSHYVQQPFLAGKHCGRSRIVDCMGRTRADTGHFPGLALAQVDLDQTYPMWYSGPMAQDHPTMRQTLFKTRRPELYGPVVQPLNPQHWERPR